MEKSNNTIHIKKIKHWSGVSTQRSEKGIIRRVINYVKPTLTNKQKQTRINFIINKINLTNNKFSYFNNYIHIDEKWFYVKKVNKNLYLGPSETITTRKTKSKKNMTKVMFLVSVSRPLMVVKRGKYLYGKIGFFPLVEELHEKEKSIKENM